MKAEFYIFVIAALIVGGIVGFSVSHILTAKNPERISQGEAYKIVESSTNILVPPESNINQTIIQKGYNTKYNLYEFTLVLQIPNIQSIKRTVFLTSDGKYILPALPSQNLSVRR